MPTSITSSGITFDDATTLTTGVVPTANIANGAVTPVKLSQPYTLATSVASTSGTAIDFTGIPLWVKRITIMLQGVSTNGTSGLTVQLGTGSTTYTNTGYLGSSDSMATAVSPNNFSAGFNIEDASMLASHIRHGIVMLFNITGNSWVALIAGGLSGVVSVNVGGGSVSLSAPLTAVRITALNGIDTFDAGTINISYEG